MNSWDSGVDGVNIGRREGLQGVASGKLRDWEWGHEGGLRWCLGESDNLRGGAD